MSENRSGSRASAAVARLGRLALTRKPVAELYDEALDTLAEFFPGERLAVWQLLHGSASLQLVRGRGWLKGDLKVPATYRPGAPERSSWTVAHNSGKAVDLLAEEGIKTSLYAMIAGEEMPFGKLAVHSTRVRSYDDEESYLLQALANVLGGVVSRREAERQRSQSAALQKGILDSLPAHIAVLDDVGTVFMVNEAWRKFALSQGLDDPAHGVGTNYLEVCRRSPDEDSRQVAAGLQAVLAGALDRYALEYPCHSPEMRRWFHLTVDVVDLDDRRGAVVMHLDVTQRYEAEERIRHASKMEATGRLAAGVAHDFNNLLTVILNYSDVLLAENDGLPPDPLCLQEIHKAGLRAAALTRQLLSFSRCSPQRAEQVDLNQVLGDMDRLLQKLVGEDVALALEMDARTPALRIDRSQLEQVIMNLAVNARDAMPRGGQLRIKTGNQPHLQPSDKLEPGSYAELVVSDTGIGMDKTTSQRLFEPFFTTKPPGKGTGLGLATVFTTVQQNGGHLEVKSELGQGTTFRILLPASASPSPPTPAPAPETPSPQGRETILLAEDEDSIRLVTRLALEPLGYQILLARDGLEALHQIESRGGEIDLLVTDVLMPGMNGPELAAHLHQAHPGKKVLYISGDATDTLRNHRTQVHYLEKPFTPGVLARKIREVLDSPTFSP